MNLESFFNNPFILERIGRERKILFTEKVIQGIVGVNPGGIYTGYKVAIETPFNIYKTRVGQAESGDQVSSTGKLDKLEVKVKFSLKVLKTRIADKNKLDVNAIKAFFPKLSDTIYELKRGEVSVFLENTQTKVNAQVALLGADMKTMIDDLVTEWDEAFEEQGSAISQKSNAAADVNQNLWVEVAGPLFLFLLKLREENPDNPGIIGTYFDQSIINTHRSRTFILKLPANGIAFIEHGAEAGEFFFATKKGIPDIRSFYSITDHTFDGDMQEIITNIRTKIMFDNYHVDFGTHKFLVFQNLSSTEEVEIKIVFS